MGASRNKTRFKAEHLSKVNPGTKVNTASCLRYCRGLVVRNATAPSSHARSMRWYRAPASTHHDLKNQQPGLLTQREGLVTCCLSLSPQHTLPRQVAGENFGHVFGCVPGVSVRGKRPGVERTRSCISVGDPHSFSITRRHVALRFFYFRCRSDEFL